MPRPGSLPKPSSPVRTAAFVAAGVLAVLMCTGSETC